MSAPAESWKVLPNGPLTAVDDGLSTSLSLDELPDLPVRLLEWSEDDELRSIASHDPIVIEFPQGPWRQPSEPLS